MSDIDQHFIAVFEATYVDLVRFAARRVERSRAEDIAAEAFATAWRRRTDLPSTPDEARAWLFGIARILVLAHQRRANSAVTVQIENTLAVGDHQDSVIAHVDLASAWNRLTAVHQEALSVSAWDGLNSMQAAVVLGISPVAYRIRLSRARKALRIQLDLLEQAPSGPMGRIEEVKR